MKDLEHDFWSMVREIEAMKTEKRGRMVRMGRTREKVKRVGIMKTLFDWATNRKPTEGFHELMLMGRPDLTGEAIVLKNANMFGPSVREAARRRLEEAGVDVDGLIADQFLDKE